MTTRFMSRKDQSRKKQFRKQRTPKKRRANSTSNSTLMPSRGGSLESWTSVLLELNSPISEFLTLVNVLIVASTCWSTSKHFKWYQEECYAFGGIQERQFAEWHGAVGFYLIFDHIAVDEVKFWFFGERVGLEITNGWVHALTRRCRNLQNLDLSNCLHISDSALNSVAENCRSLQGLDIGSRNITNDGLKKVACQCSQLRALGMVGMTHLNKETILMLTEHCKELRSLSLSDCNLPVRTIAALSGFVNLDELDISQNNFSDVGLTEMARGCRKLEKIKMAVDIHNDTQITDDGVNALVENCPRLSEFVCCPCPWLRDASLLALSGCTNLHLAVLQECPITDVGIAALVKGCPNLSVLDISHCDFVSDEGLSNILKLEKLMHLDITCCSAMTWEAKKEAHSMTRLEGPHLHVVSEIQ